MGVQIASAKEIRLSVLKMSFLGQTVHVPSAFSLVEILRTLHSEVLNYPANNPLHPERDFLVLSKGHGVMALYAIFLSRGWLSDSDLEHYFQDGSLLPGLAESSVPGIEANTGSLGQGMSVAVGMAFSMKLQGRAQKNLLRCWRWRTK